MVGEGEGLKIAHLIPHIVIAAHELCTRGVGNDPSFRLVGAGPSSAESARGLMQLQSTGDVKSSSRRTCPPSWAPSAPARRSTGTT